MANNINPVNFGITNAQYLKIKEKQEEPQKDLNKEKQAKEEKQVDSKEVLGYMAAQGLDMMPVRSQKVLDVSKYVNDEQAARIEDFMKDFEANFDEQIAIVKDEFPGISDELAMDLVLANQNASI